MKTMRSPKAFATLLAVCLLASLVLAGCGESGSKSQTYTMNFVASTDKTPPEVTFTKENFCTYFLTGQMGGIGDFPATMTIDLTVEGDNYTIDVVNHDKGAKFNDIEIDENSNVYYYVKTHATGTCKVDGNTITLEPATSVDYEFKVGELISSLNGTADHLSYGDAGGAGSWSSASDSAVLSACPGAILTIDGSTITSVKANGSIESFAEDFSGTQD